MNHIPDWFTDESQNLFEKYYNSLSKSDQIFHDSEEGFYAGFEAAFNFLSEPKNQIKLKKTKDLLEVLKRVRRIECIAKRSLLEEDVNKALSVFEVES